MYQSEEHMRSRSFGRVSFQTVASTDELGKKTTPRRLLPLENQLSQSRFGVGESSMLEQRQQDQRAFSEGRRGTHFAT